MEVKFTGTKIQPKIIIIGAGISGLTTAANLITKGFKNVDILEARSRIGGRLSAVTIDGINFEEGATFVHGTTDNPINPLLQEVQLNWKVRDGDDAEICAWYIDHDYSNPPANVNGRLQHDIAKILCDAFGGYEEFPHNTILAKFRENGMGPNSHLEYLTRWLKIVIERTRKAFGNIDIQEQHVDMLLHYFHRLCVLSEYNFEGTPTLCNSPIWSFDQYCDLEGEHTRLEGSYDSILQPLLAKIPTERLHLSCEVREIDWSLKERGDFKVHGNTEGKPVIITYSDKDGNVQKTHADHVIVTIPLGCLKANHKKLFTPTLPGNKIAAIENTGFCNVEKIILIYDKPFVEDKVQYLFLLWQPEESIMSEDWRRNLGQFDILREPNSHKFRLETYLVGKDCKTVSALSNEEVGKCCSDVLRKFLKNTEIPDPTHIYRSSFFKDPYSLGSYSYLTKHNSRDDVSVLSEPLSSDVEAFPLQLLFGGEATHIEFFSTVHGGFASGEREADRIIDHYS